MRHECGLLVNEIVGWTTSNRGGRKKGKVDRPFTASRVNTSRSCPTGSTGSGGGRREELTSRASHPPSPAPHALASARVWRGILRQERRLVRRVGLTRSQRGRAANLAAVNATPGGSTTHSCEPARLTVCPFPVSTTETVCHASRGHYRRLRSCVSDRNRERNSAVG